MTGETNKNIQTSEISVPSQVLIRAFVVCAYGSQGFLQADSKAF